MSTVQHTYLSTVNRRTLLTLALALLVQIMAVQMSFAKSDTGMFVKSDAASTTAIDHSAWDALLKSYVKAGGDGLNRVDYAGFKKNGHQALKSYLAKLQAVDVTALNRDEQFAYWVNLYNAVTIDVILDNYPVKSIKDVKSSFFSPGPWRLDLVTVNGVKLTLDDVEHNILRKHWQEPRVHYAVNCASIGCPNLAVNAYTGATLEAMLTAGARAYINSPRGVSINGDNVTASGIYKWFKKDFGSSQKNVLAHLQKYAAPELASKLRNASEISDYKYDWVLNDAR